VRRYAETSICQVDHMLPKLAARKKLVNNTNFGWDCARARSVWCRLIELAKPSSMSENNTAGFAFRVAGNLDPSQFPGQLEKECVLFFHPSCKELAAKVAATSEGITLGQIDWRCDHTCTLLTPAYQSLYI
jgi:hypothetical protein